MTTEAIPLPNPLRDDTFDVRRDPPSSGDATVSVAQIARAILRQRQIVTRSAVGLAILVTTVILLQGRHYTVTSSFVPDSRRPTGNLSGLAAQLGVPMGGADMTESPQFYADLVWSRELLRRAAVDRYPATSSDSSQVRPLTEQIGAGATSDARAVEKTILWLRKRIGASPGAKTGVIALTVTAPTAELAQQVNAHLLALINQFNLETRQSRAAQERKFAEGRIVELRGELRQAEDALAAFLARNRGDLRDVPDLAFQRDRLAREAQLRQAVYGTMVQSFEQARLDEVRDTPLITIVDPPHRPLDPDSRGLAIKFLAALLGGAFIGAIFATMRAGFDGDLMHHQPTREELADLWRSTLRDARRPWQLLARGTDQ